MIDIIARRLALAISLTLSGLSYAEDLGKYGSVWAIAEPDAIESIKNKIRKMEKDGSLRKRQEEYRDRSLAGIKNPSPLPGISSAKEYRSWDYDPTYTYENAMKDETGKIIVPAGTKLNPLDYQPLGKRLLFIDGRDGSQVAYARKLAKGNPDDKVILTAGSFIDLSRDFGRRVYFDQRGILTKHFGIHYVPAMITQKGRLLKIEEGIKK